MKTDALHGYAIMTAVAEVTDDVLRVEEGSLYPALHRMEDAGWIRWATRFTNLFRQRGINEEPDAELASHIEEAVRRGTGLKRI